MCVEGFPHPCLSDGRKALLAYEWNRAKSLTDKMPEHVTDDLEVDDLVQELLTPHAPVACKNGHEAWLMLHPKHELHVIFVELPGRPPKWFDGRSFIGQELVASRHEDLHDGLRVMVERGEVEVRGGLLICQASLLRAAWHHSVLQILEVDLQKRDVIQMMLREQAGLAFVA